jgi:hypothetical protein
MILNVFLLMILVSPVVWTSKIGRMAFILTLERKLLWSCYGKWSNRIVTDDTR